MNFYEMLNSASFISAFCALSVVLTKSVYTYGQPGMVNILFLCFAMVSMIGGLTSIFNNLINRFTLEKKIA